jgi:hypothetical protein
MDFDATIDIIIKDLKEIREIVNDLKKYPDVPQLQIELAKSKCRSAEEIISLLKEYKPVKKEEKEVVSVKQPEPENVSLIEIADEALPEVSEVPVSDPAQAIPVINKHEDISELFRSKAGSVLSEFIGLNDKFLFIRGIFGGNAGSYEEALAKLSKAENLPDAKAIIMSYTGEAEETEEVSHLLELVKQKLPSNG